jgi:hypothetical protein
VPRSLLSSRGSLSSLACAQDRLDDLLLLNEKSADDALADASSAAGATISARNLALTALQSLQLGGADSGKLRK